MATQSKPTMKNSPRIVRGKNRNNKPADAYAYPHTVSGKKITGEEVMKAGVYATDKSANKAELKDPIPNGVSYGVSREAKTDGIEMRGTGAANKGKMSRGPMA
jgi:hypothetical protein